LAGFFGSRRRHKDPTPFRSMDAIATNAAVATTIRDTRAGFLLAVKANQPTVRAEIETFFADAHPGRSPIQLNSTSKPASVRPMRSMDQSPALSPKTRLSVLIRGNMLLSQLSTKKRYPRVNTRYCLFGICLVSL
jgi:hypothetical protein